MSALVIEADLVAAAANLAGSRKSWSAAERSPVHTFPEKVAIDMESLREGIDAGFDPICDTFCRIRSPKIRHVRSTTYTPSDIVQATVSWSASEQGKLARIVDPRTGSDRFLSAAADRFPSAQLVAVQSYPVAALVLRATQTRNALQTA